MKDLNLQKEIEQIKKVSLTTDEKSKMLHNLSVYADYHMPVSSPISLFSFFKQPLVRKYSYVLATVLITVLTGGSLAYASETSLPGDLLYPIKTSVVEPIKISLAKTPEQKAILQSEFANRRLKEAEDLDKTGRLTSEFKKKLDEKFNTHFSKYNEIRNSLGKNISSSSKQKVDELQNEFERRINDHAEILNKMDRDISGLKKIQKEEIENFKRERQSIKDELRLYKELNRGTRGSSTNEEIDE